VIRDQRQFDNYVVSQNQLLADFINNVSTRMNEYGPRVSQLETTTSKQLEVTAQLRAIAEKLEAIREQYDLLEHSNNAHFDNLEKQLGAYQAQTNEQLKTLEIQFENHVQSRLEKEGTERRSEILKQQQLMKATAEDLRAEIERVYLQLRRDRANINGDLPMPKGQTSTETHRLDAMYAALEDRFRGDREEVKQRFEVYLPYLKRTETLRDAPLIDVGSGRGEWLELLKEADIKAYGIEQNRIAIDRCRARGLDVIENDAIVHLHSIGAESIGAVTGFHIIEHLPLDTLVHLLDQVMRILRPGGLVIFETPNPENVVVGSNFFYLDPTHRHPLPSELMQFLFEYRGFHGVEVINLHPWDSGRVAGEGELAERFNGYFFGPMDYAILGWKVEP
jgi:O-antigen chain-terminating methyltransferase